MTWLWIALAILVFVLVLVIAVLIWVRRSGMTPTEATSWLRELGVDLVRLPVRLKRSRPIPAHPRRARWWLLGLAIYIASPIDPIPDFIPVIGYLDEIVLVPLILRHIRRMIPDEVWTRELPASSVERLRRSEQWKCGQLLAASFATVLIRDVRSGRSRIAGVEMQTFMVISTAGPNRDLTRDTREQPFWDEHAAFIDGLVENGSSSSAARWSTRAAR